MTQYMDFISQIPDEVLQKTERHLCSNIALFKPLVYMAGVTLNANDYHIVIPSGNTPDTIFNYKTIRADQGKIMAINPGDTVSSLRNMSTKPYYSILIKPGLLHKIAEEMDYSGEIRFINIFNPFSAELLQTLKCFERETNRSDRIKLVLDCLEIQIAALVLREFKTNIKKYVFHSHDADSYVSRAIDYMRTYFSSNITIEDICSEIHVSHFHFIRVFKQKVGLSPHRYLLNVRIEKAEELLSTRGYSVAETAALCGFVSVPHFSATFKEATGYSPADYRMRRKAP